MQQTAQLPGGTTSALARVFGYDGDNQILGRTDGTVDASTGAFTALSGATTANPDALAPQHYVYAEGHPVATLSEAGAIQTRDGLTPYSDPQSVGSYTVQAGDTLQGIAQSVYGNSSLWYVIADANAISLDGSGNAINLVAGTTLKLPAVRNSQNSSQTFTPYNPLKLIGSTTPALAALPPPPPQHCNDLTTLIVVAVTIAVTVYTAGAAAEELGAVAASGSGSAGAIGAAALTGGTLTAAGGATLGLGTDLLAAGIGGLAGSVAGQLAGQALGDGAGFSLREALGAGLGSALTAGAGSLIGGGQSVAELAKARDYSQIAALGAAGSLDSLAGNRLVGEPSAFSWASVAAASLSSTLTAGLHLPTLLDQGVLKGSPAFWQNALGGVVNGELGAGIGRALGASGEPGLGTIVADAFGNALANRFEQGLNTASSTDQGIPVSNTDIRQQIKQDSQINTSLDVSNLSFPLAPLSFSGVSGGTATAASTSASRPADPPAIALPPSGSIPVLPTIVVTPSGSFVKATPQQEALYAYYSGMEQQDQQNRLEQVQVNAEIVAERQHQQQITERIAAIEHAQFAMLGEGLIGAGKAVVNFIPQALNGTLPMARTGLELYGALNGGPLDLLNDPAVASIPTPAADAGLRQRGPGRSRRCGGDVAQRRQPGRPGRLRGAQAGDGL